MCSIQGDKGCGHLSSKLRDCLNLDRDFLLLRRLWNTFNTKTRFFTEIRSPIFHLNCSMAKVVKFFKTQKVKWLFENCSILESTQRLNVSFALVVLPCQISNLGDISFRSKVDERKFLSWDFFFFFRSIIDLNIYKIPRFFRHIHGIHDLCGNCHFSAVKSQSLRPNTALLTTFVSPFFLRNQSKAAHAIA